MGLPHASLRTVAALVGVCALGPASTVFASADLYLTKTGPGGARPGDNLVYTIEVGNAGPDAVRDAVVTDVTPLGLTLVSVSGPCTPPSTFPCNLPSMSAGDLLTLTATFAVPVDYAGGNVIVNTATVTSSVADDFTANNTASASTALTRVRGFYTLPPCRVADTRGTQGVPIGGPALDAGQTRTFNIRERCGLPGNAIGVSYNITVTEPTSAGDLRFFPEGEPSLASAINYVSGQTRANNGIVKVPSSGAVVAQCDQASGSVHFIMDVNGYFAASDEVPTPKGKMVRVRLAPEVELTFDEVTTGGSASARVIEFLDDRDPVNPPDKNLQDFFPQGSPERALLPNVTIPSYVRALGKGGPGGPPTFVLAIIDLTGAQFTRTAEFHGFEDFRLGWNPPCVNAADPTKEPRTFYAREAPKNEPALVEENPFENPVFVDISSGCGSNKGSGWNFSLYLSGRDSRSPHDIALFMLQRMDEALTALGNFISNRTLAGQLSVQVQEALRTLDTDPSASLASVNAFIALVDGAPQGSFDNTVRNVSGELVGRGLAARYMIGKIPQP